MYRNVYYNPKDEVMHLFTWDADGKRTKVLCSYQPYLYIESDQGCDGKSIFNTPLKKITFLNNFDRTNFVKETPIKRLFHNLGCDQQFLLDSFKDEVDSPDYAKHPLKIFYIDIETKSNGNGFSTPQDANDPINLITVYDSLKEKYYTFGCNNFSTMDEEVEYIKCSTEKDLLLNFIRFWKKDYPDIVTGWNIDGYDIPYIINRISKIWGNDDKIKELSPVSRIQFRENVSMNKMGQQIDRWYIHGISILDYMEVYKTFSLGDRESYSLGYVGEYELGEGKIAVGGYSLSKLADEDWFKFVDYNIQDVRLLVKLEEKLKYLRLVRNLSYRGFVPFTKALGKVSVITGTVAHQALKQDMIIPTFTNENIKKSFAGGFVLEPNPGLYEDVVTYDANSLYPNTIITLNISPETKIGKIQHIDDGKILLRLTNEKELTFTPENFDKFVNQQKLSITKANVLYTQKFKGVVPSLIDKLYNERISAKNRMLEAKKKIKATNDIKEIKRLEQIAVDNDTLSNVYKTLLNSIYGVFSQIYSPLFDIDHAESVTLTGQEVVKNGAKIVHSFLKENGYTKDISELCIFSDTDSLAFSLNSYFKLKSVKLVDNDKITDDARKIINDIGEHLNKEINDWAIKELKTTDPRYFFKREKICDVALLQAKKYYILHILDSEGVATKEFLYKGIEIAKSILSREVKDLLKEVIESAILSRDRKIANHIFQEGYEKFCKMTPEMIATRKKVNNFNKWEDEFDEETGKVGKGTPMHTKGSIYYNNLLKVLNLEHKYPKIESGSKIKYLYCKDNKFGYKLVSFGEEYPKEFLQYIKPDYKFIFEKNAVPVISRIFKVIGWPLPSIGCEEHTDIISLFS
jgi:DNA polymerase elongation subunit (family B)